MTREQIASYLDTYILGKPFVFGALVSPQMAKEQHLDLAHFEALIGAKPWVQPAEEAPKAAPSAKSKQGGKPAKAPAKGKDAKKEVAK